MNSVIRVSAFANVVALVLGLSIHCRDDIRSAEVVAADVLGAWTRRGEQAKTFECSWVEERLVRRGAWTHPLEEPSSEEVPIRPDRDLPLSCRFRLVISGDWFRSESHDYQWSFSESRAVPRSIVNTYDGMTAMRSFTANDMESRHATIEHGVRENDDEGMLSIRPFLLHFRGHTGRYFDLNKAIVSVDNSRPSIVLAINRASNQKSFQIAPPRIDSGRLLHVDPSRDFVVTQLSLVQYPVEGPPVTNYQITINYEKDAQKGWIPNKWNFVDSHDGRPRTSGSATVTQCLINGNYEKSLFRIRDFDVGTFVTTTTPGRPREHSIVMRDGSRQTVTQSEFGQSRERLLARPLK
jgi:hypothetical protein